MLRNPIEIRSSRAVIHRGKSGQNRTIGGPAGSWEESFAADRDKIGGIVPSPNLATCS
jgi:hypothetical protein